MFDLDRFVTDCKAAREPTARTGTCARSCRRGSIGVSPQALGERPRRLHGSIKRTISHPERRLGPMMTIMPITIGCGP